MTFYKKLGSKELEKMFSEGKIRGDRVGEIFGYVTFMDKNGQNYAAHLTPVQKKTFQEEIFRNNEFKDNLEGKTK